MAAPVLAFDIETVPDVDGLRALNESFAELTDEQVAQSAFDERRARTGSDFLPLHLHRIVAIACLFRDDSGIRIKSIGTADDDEARLVGDFFRIIERHTPQLVSWNGGGFDAQVLHYRALIHGISASRYWELGDDDREFRFNHYIGRYHARHLDLMDLLARYTPRANAPLDQLAKLCGFPGKMGFDGAQVWPAFRDGRLAEIRAYCETDVANTFLVYCRFQLMRGWFTDEQYQQELGALRAVLQALPGEHWRAFLGAWPASR